MVLDFEVQSGIIKNNISDLFAIFFVLGTALGGKKKINECIIERGTVKSSVEKLMSTVDWNSIFKL